MPLSEHHRRQRKKNFALLAVLLAFMAIIYALTLAKFTP